jgi:hypothetical protein
MANKYIPANRKEIQLLRRNRAIKESSRSQITDNTLIALRRVHLKINKNSAEFEVTSIKFNDFLNKLNHKKIQDVINYYIADIQ